MYSGQKCLLACFPLTFRGYVFRVCGLALLAAQFGLSAAPRIPVEIGAGYAFGHRAEDRFSRGMHKFRSSPDPNVLRAVSVDPFPVMESAEYYLRAGLLDSEHHLIGITGGNYFIADMPLWEIRSDGVISFTNWSFAFPYFMLTYHYAGHIPGRWNRKLQLAWDGGAGFGFIFGSKWQLRGATFSNVQALQYNSKQRGRIGNIMRLELGLRRRLWRGAYFRIGLRSSFLHVGNWAGDANSGTGDWYYARDGSLLLLSSFNLALYRNLTLPSPSALTSFSLIRSKAYHNSGVTEIQFSIGYRWD